MEENNNEKKKITKKQIITMSVGVGILIVLAITATYAFFRFGNNNAFGTSKITGKTPDSDASSVVLENINTTLTLGLETNDMLQTNGNTIYWASPEGKKTTETINQIGKAKAMVEGTYTCNYTMTIEDKAISENSLYNAFQGMSTKSNNQIVLTVNEEEYDFNQNNLFPITYNGILSGITQSDYQYITASMYIKNELTIDQTPLSNKDIDIEFKVTSLNCMDESLLPTITNFFIGDSTNQETVTVVTKAPIYLEFNNDNIEKYCISTSNKSKNCSWIDTNGKQIIKTNYDLNGQTSGELSLYAYIKDNSGNISEARNDSATLTSGTLQFIVEEGVGEFYYKLGSETTYTRVTETTTLNASPGAYTYYGLPEAGYLMNECTKTTPCTGNLGIEAQYRIVSATPSLGNGATYLAALANSNSTPNFIVQSHPDSTVQTGTNQATDYRYIGASDNVENYVCLGNLQSNGQCQDTEHLYRIIGVMPTQTTKSGSYENRIKLIKWTEYLDSDKVSAGSYTPSGYGYYWTGQKTNGSGNYASYTGASVNYNNWEESTLNRVILNQTYYNSLDEKYQNMIGNSVWYLGGRDDSSATSSGFYISERSESIYLSGSRVNPTYTEKKIGLMYPSDYGFATTGGTTTNRATCLTTNLYSWHENGVTDCKNNDWLYMSNGEQWTIAPRSSHRDNAFLVLSNGSVNGYNDVYVIRCVVRPVFSLTSESRVLSGTGSINSPYTLG